MKPERLPKGMKIINYYSSNFDHALKISFFNAEGIEAGGEVGFEQTALFQNYRTASTHVHKGGPVPRDYSEMAEAVAYLALYQQKIHLLGDMLGETIVEQEGQECLDLVEAIRGLAKAHRTGDEEAGERLIALIRELPLEKTRLVAKAFATYFQLVNLAEDEERVRVLRES